MKNSRLILQMFVFSLIMSSCAMTIKEDAQLDVFFDSSIKEDATASVLKKVLVIDDNAGANVTFEKGTYHFYPDKGKEFFSYISNHDDVLTRTAFPLIGKKNITVDGQGSTFIFHGRMIPFLIEESSNITIKNLSIDWAQSFHSEGKIVANDSEKGTFDMRISEEYPYEIRNRQLVFIKEYHEHTIGQSIAFDPETGGIAFDTEKYTPISSNARTALQFNSKAVYDNYKYEYDPREPLTSSLGVEKRIWSEQLEPGLIRVFNHNKKMPLVGTILACKGEKGDNRVAPAIRITGVTDFLAENVTVHHAGGMGLIAENSENLTLDGFKVIPSKGRMVSTTADATHFVGCRGKVILKNCVFNNMLDDGTNVHGSYQKVVEILGEKEIGIRVGHFQQQNFVIGKPGDSIGFVRLNDSFSPYDNLTLASVQIMNGRYQIMTFNEQLPKGLKPGDLIENNDAYPELLIQNCEVAKNRARGFLISTPKEVIIENNLFNSEMEAILIPVESGFWYESGSASNVTIRNNTFQDCLHSGQNRGLIRLVTDDDNENIAFRNIKITGNRFNHFDNMVLEVNNTDGFTFRDNIITKSTTYPALFPKNPVIRIKSSKNLDFGSNKYEGEAVQIFETDEPMKLEL